MSPKLIIMIDLDLEADQSRYDIFDVIRRSMVVGAANASARFAVGDHGDISENGNRIGDWAVVSR